LPRRGARLCAFVTTRHEHLPRRLTTTIFFPLIPFHFVITPLNVMLYSGNSLMSDSGRTQDNLEKLRIAAVVLGSDRSSDTHLLRDEKALRKIMGVEIDSRHRRKGRAKRLLDIHGSDEEPSEHEENDEEVVGGRNDMTSLPPTLLAFRAPPPFSPGQRTSPGNEAQKTNWSATALPQHQMPFSLFSNDIKSLDQPSGKRSHANNSIRPGSHSLMIPSSQAQPQSNHALQDYQMQLMLLEQQNKKRILMARQEQDAMYDLRQEDVRKRQHSSSPQQQKEHPYEHTVPLVEPLSEPEDSDGNDGDAVEPLAEQQAVKSSPTPNMTPFKYTISEDLTVNDRVRQAHFVALQNHTKTRFVMSARSYPT
jgi:hypothetical protein